MSRNKYLTILLASLVMSSCAYAQVKNSIGLSIELADQNVELLNSKWTAFDSALSTRARLYFQRKLSPSWSIQLGAFAGGLNYLRTRDQTFSNATIVGGDVRMMLTLNNGRLIQQDALIGPFLLSGYEVSKVSGPVSTSFWNLNYGAGFNIRLSPHFNVQVTSILNQRLTDNFNTSLIHGLGGTYSFVSRTEIKEKKDKVKDSDLDGIADVNDKCPDEAGTTAYYGCPSSVALAQALNPVEETEEVELTTDDMARLEGLVRTLYKENDSLRYELNQSKLQMRSLERRLEALEQGEVVEKRKEDDAIPDGEVNKTSPLVVTQDEPPKSESEPEPETVEVESPVKDKTQSEQSQKDHNRYRYYVVTISTPTNDLAQQWESDLSAKFPNAGVKIYRQDNGYNRVGLYESDSKEEVIRRMEEVRSLGHPKAWVAKYPIVN